MQCFLLLCPLMSDPLAPEFMLLRGCVISGRGTASKRKIVKSPISDFFGELPAPGSLNVSLEKPVRINPEKVAFVKDDRTYCWASEINGTRCLVTRRKGHPLHIVEILSPYLLREKFQLKNGDSVEISLPHDFIVDLSWKTNAIWSVFWKHRNRWYASRTYRMLIGPFWLVRRLASQSPEYHPKLRSKKTSFHRTDPAL